MVDVLQCHGNAAFHCCVVGGVQCEYVEEGTVPGRRWACGLVRRYGSWLDMASSVEYEPIGTHWVNIGKPWNYCETFLPAFCCRPEWRLGRRSEQDECVIDLIGVT